MESFNLIQKAWREKSKNPSESRNVQRENKDVFLPLNVTDVAVLLVILRSEIDVWVPEPDHSEVPAEWWDAEADKSLLIGVFKHGE